MSTFATNPFARAGRAALGWVEGQLKVRPVAFNMASAGSITCLGDIIAQNFELRGYTAPLPATPGTSGASGAAAVEAGAPPPSSSASSALPSYRSAQYEWRRTILIGSFIAATTPLWLMVYKVGDRLCQGNRSILRACGQGLFTWSAGTAFSPIFVTYMTVSSAVVIHKVRDAPLLVACVEERLRKNYFTHAAAALCFWSVHWIPLFYLLPPHFRILYASTLQVFWNTIVSFIQHRN